MTSSIMAQLNTVVKVLVSAASPFVSVPWMTILPEITHAYCASIARLFRFS